MDEKINPLSLNVPQKYIHAISVNIIWHNGFWRWLLSHVLFSMDYFYLLQIKMFSIRWLCFDVTMQFENYHSTQRIIRIGKYNIAEAKKNLNLILKIKFQAVYKLRSGLPGSENSSYAPGTICPITNNVLFSQSSIPKKNIFITTLHSELSCK